VRVGVFGEHTQRRASTMVVIFADRGFELCQRCRARVLRERERGVVALFGRTKPRDQRIEQAIAATEALVLGDRLHRRDAHAGRVVLQKRAGDLQRLVVFVCCIHVAKQRQGAGSGEPLLLGRADHREQQPLSALAFRGLARAPDDGCCPRTHVITRRARKPSQRRLYGLFAVTFAELVKKLGEQGVIAFDLQASQK
jgi:hypothetical protein